MKVLHILKQDPNPTASKIIETHKSLAQVETIDLRTDTNYDEIVDKIVSADKVISW